jgi:MSHA biogenesis protein MshI
MMKLHLRWPWRRRAATDRLVIGSLADSFAYAQADATGQLRRCGIERRGTDSAADFTRRVRALQLPAREVCAVLPLAEAQLIQIDAPAVKPEEMKAAARWRIKDQVEGRIDELTIDVMRVGDEGPRSQRHLFVAAARNDAIRALDERARAAGLELAVIDMVETSQRNLQSAVAQAEGLLDRATAALVRHGEQCLLTICAGGELFYTRRLAWAGFARDGADAPEHGGETGATGLEAADFVDYGAEAELAAADDGVAPRGVIEVQRSFDVWERSWPDLPLAALWVAAGNDTAALTAWLQTAIGQRVALLDPERVIPGLSGLDGGDEDQRAALLPVLGALLRAESRQL